MLTARQLALQLLRYTGVTQLGRQPEGSLQDSYEPADGQEVVSCINAALQETYALAPRWFSHQSQALALTGPQTVTFNATAGSAEISAAAPASAFIQGCTLAPGGGDVLENEIVNSSTLLRPFQGVTGPVTATLYGDCVPLAPGVAVVNGPVILVGYRELFPASNYSDLLDMDYRYRATFGNYGTSVAVTSRAQPRTVAQPLGYFVDTFVDPATGANVFGVRLVPIPDGPYIMRFEARMGPTVITTADLGTDAGGDPGTGFALPNGWDEAVLLPVALMRWTASSLFKNEAALPQIQRNYTLAMERMVPASRPQANAKQRLTIGCY